MLDRIGFGGSSASPNPFRRTFNMEEKLAPKFTAKGIKYISFDQSKITEKNKWKTIEQLILDYTTLHANEVRDIVLACKEHKAVAYVKTASSQGKSLRFAVMLPMGLSVILKRIDPELLKGKSLHMFMRRFPMFCIPEKI